MKYKDGFKRYLSVMAKIGQECAELRINNKCSESDKRLKIFYGFMEISKTLDSLKLNYKFMRLSAPKSVKESKYIEYHFFVYLQEVYSLKEKIISYLNVIQKLFTKKIKSNKQEIENNFKPLFELVSDSLDNLTDIRNSHIHQKTYMENDLSWSLNYDFLKNLGYSEYKDMANISNKKTRLKYKNILKTNCKNINQMINMYFSLLVDSDLN